MALGKGKGLLDLYDIKQIAFLSIFFVKCISFCDLRSIRRNEIYCAMLGKKGKCRIKNGKQGADVESSKKEKTEVCVCVCVCMRVRACVVKHRPPRIVLGIFRINFITARIDY